MEAAVSAVVVPGDERFVVHVDLHAELFLCRGLVLLAVHDLPQVPLFRHL